MKKLNVRNIIAICLVVVALIISMTAARNVNAEKGYGVLSLLTPVVAIVLAFITKEVILSLGIAVLVGATAVNGGNLLQGFFHTCDTYIVGTLTDSWDATLLAFILVVGGFVALLGKMGGMQAMALALSKKAKSAKNSLIVTWLLGIVIFFEDMANSLIVGPTMRPITDSHKVSREKLSYVVDSTAGPVTDIALISSWIAYEISMIHTGAEAAGLDPNSINAYSIFLRTIPFRFYNILAIAMVGIIVISQRDYGPMYRAEKRARLTGKLYEDNAKPMMSPEMDSMNYVRGIKLKVSNAIIPIVVFVVATLAAMWYTGGGPKEPFNLTGIQNAFGNCNSASSIFYAVVLCSILCVVMAVSQKILALTDAISTWLNGCKELMLTVFILTLAWSAGGVMRDLGTGAYIAGIVGDSLPRALFPMIIFIVGCFVSFSTGTSYGTTGILIPIVFPMAVAMTGGEINNWVICAIAAVTCGAIFGDHCSPISDTTIMSSMGSAADLMDHAKTQLPYAATVAAVATVLGFLPAACGVSPWILLPIGVVALIVIVRLLGKSTKTEDLMMEAEKGQTA